MEAHHRAGLTGCHPRGTHAGGAWPGGSAARAV